MDHRNQVHKATAAHGSLFSGSVFTGGLYGYIVALTRAIRDVRATQVVVATDTPPYQRRLDFPGYKGNRKVSKPGDDPDVALMKAAASFKLVDAFLAQAIACPLWSVPGYEYDDICAWAAGAFSSRFDRIVAMTNDSDLYQCFDIPNFYTYKNATVGVYGRAEFEAEKGPFDRDRWCFTLAMSGTHNAVPGIPGIGPVKAHMAASTLDTSAVYRNNLRIVTRNLDLIRLPHPMFPKRPDLRLHKHVFELHDVSKFCARYEIRMTQAIVEALQDIRAIT